MTGIREEHELEDYQPYSEYASSLVSEQIDLTHESSHQLTDETVLLTNSGSKVLTSKENGNGLYRWSR